MNDEGERELRDGIRPDDAPGEGRGQTRGEERAPDEGPADDHDYEPHFDRVRESVEDLTGRLDRIIQRCEAVEDPGPRQGAILRRARELRERIEGLTDRSGVMLGLGHMRLETRVQLLEIRLRELEEEE